MNKWLKISGIVLVAVLALGALLGGAALAQGPVDEDGDGVCDVCGQQAGDGFKHGWQHRQSNQSAGCDGTGTCGDGFVDENGDGVCDRFVDEDGDGVCDHHLADGQGQGNQNGCGMHSQGRQPAQGGHSSTRGMGSRVGYGQQRGN